MLRVEACGLCGTDHEQFTGELFPGYAFVPGHESVGVIERIGSRAAQRWGVEAGARVAVEVFLSCGECAQCRAGVYRRCVHHGLRDMYGYVPVDRAPGLWGGYAEYQYLAADSMLCRVPDSLDPVTASLFNPLGAGIRWAVTVPETKRGDVVAVLGPGVRGISAVAAAKNAGASFVMITGLGARDAPASGDRIRVRRRSRGRRRSHRSRRGAARGDRRACRRRGRRHRQGTLRPRAGHPARTTRRHRRDRGTRGGGGTPGFDPDLIVYKELRVLGALGVDAAAYGEALALLASGRFPFADLPRRVVGLAGAAELLRDMAGEGDIPPVHGVIVPGKDR